ncbi:MAG: hypothetical protein MPW15_07840 [Candidatus Manganitrophus sp.]|nr:hypothetical protein [Candidatus Manganitrophus sp.]
MDEQIEEEKKHDPLTPVGVIPETRAGEPRNEAPIEKTINGA